jgi:hypothetical protein
VVLNTVHCISTKSQPGDRAAVRPYSKCGSRPA